jgi:hypothetical protein
MTLSEEHSWNILGDHFKRKGFENNGRNGLFWDRC